MDLIIMLLITIHFYFLIPIQRNYFSNQTSLPLFFCLNCSKNYKTNIFCLPYTYRTTNYNMNYNTNSFGYTSFIQN